MPVVIDVDKTESAEIGAVEQQILIKLLSAFPEIQEPSLVEREIELTTEEAEELAGDLWEGLRYLNNNLRMEDLEAVKEHLLCLGLLRKMLNIQGLQNIPSQAEVASLQEKIEKAGWVLHAKRQTNLG